MHKTTRCLAASMVLGLAASCLAVSPACAAEEARYDVEGSSGSYVTISNVVAEVPAAILFVAEAPVKVTFHGGDLSSEYIMAYEGAEVADDIVHLHTPLDLVRFDVKYYTYFGETQVRDERTEEMEKEGVYLTGNYATLTTPGYYVVATAPLHVSPTWIHVQVVEPSAHQSAPTAAPEAVSAVPTASRVLVDGKEVAFEAYNINGSNYFKLRDLAMALSGSEKQFQVLWDVEYNAINLISGRPYTPVGGELVASGDPSPRQAVPTTSKVFVNGPEAQLTAFNIGGSNYFKLRDVAQALGFGITWDPVTSTIGIDSAGTCAE